MTRSRHPRPGILVLTALTAACALATAYAAAAQDEPPIIWSIAAHAGNVVNVGFTADGQIIVSAAGREARTWNAADGSPRQVFPDQPSNVIDVAVSPDSRYVAVGFVVTGYPPSAQMRLWETETETVVATYSGSHVAFSPAGDLVVSGGAAVNRHASVHRLADGVEVGHYYNGPGTPTEFAFSPDGSLLAVACTDGTIKLWDIASGTRVRTFTGHADYVTCVAFSPDGTALASGGGGYDTPGDASVKLWRVSDGQLLRTLPGYGEWAYSVSFGPDGSRLVTSGREGQNPYTAAIKFWRTEDGVLLQSYPVLASVATFAPHSEVFCYGVVDGALVLAGGEDVTSIADGLPQATVSLGQNTPNPFNPATEIRFELPAAGRVRLEVFSVDGRLVRSLVHDHLAAGVHMATWNGRDDTGRPAPSGAYLYRLAAGGEVVARTLTLIQ